MRRRVARSFVVSVLVSIPAFAAPGAAQVVFGPPVADGYPPFSATPRLAAGDVDGDGFADLVVGTSGAPSLRLGDGGGHFAPASPIAVDATGSSVALADLDGDGALDLLVGSSLTAQLRVATGGGDGTFELAAVHALGQTTTGSNQLSIDVGDADGDGDIDVLAVTAGAPFGATGEARLFRNLGTGALGMVGAVTSSGSPGSRVAAGFLCRLNADARPDMVVRFETGVMLAQPLTSALACQPDATFASTWTSTTLLPHRPADLDGDGDLDLVAGTMSPPLAPPETTLVPLLNPGDGAFVAGAPGPTLAAPTGFAGGCTADFDGDGAPDFALLTAFPPELRALRGQGDGSFAVSASVSLGGGVAGTPPLVADFDGDGRLDVTCSLGGSSAQPSQVVSFNRSYAAGGPISDLGHQLKGAQWPILIAEGEFAGDEPFAFQLSGAPAGAAVHIIVGTTVLEAPFKGGVLVPLPLFIAGPLLAAPDGTVTLAGDWPAGPAGFVLVMQFWIADAAGPVGLAASSGLVIVTQ